MRLFIDPSIHLSIYGFLYPHVYINIKKKRKEKKKKKKKIPFLTSFLLQVKSIFVTQGRLRENLKSMEKHQDSTLTKRYLKDLNDQEDELYAVNKLKNQATDDLARIAQELRQLQVVLTLEAVKATKDLL